MDFDKSSIERLKRTLYSRNENIVPKEKRTPVQPSATASEDAVPADWGDKPNFDIPLEEQQKNNSFFNKFLLGSVVFFLLALGAAAFIFFGGINTISSNSVNIQVVAPSTTASGQELDVAVTVENGNPTDLQDVTLYIDYPDGVTSVDTPGKVLTHDQITLGNIAKGASQNYTIRAFVSGQKDAVKTFTLRAEYKVTGSTSVFSKETTYQVAISSSPILLDIVSPAQVNSGEPVTLTVHVTSNSTADINNALVEVAYPFGFTYQSSSLKPLRNNATSAAANTIWSLGDLQGGNTTTLTITGTLVGQDAEDRSFTVSAGTQSLDPTQDFGTVLATALSTVGIRKSFFDLSVTAPNSDVASIGEGAPISVGWQNTLTDPTLNNQVTATISGNAFDPASVQTQNGGFYSSAQNTISWDKNSTANLSSISPGDTGQVSFSVASPSNPAQVLALRNPHINVHIVMTGQQTGSDTSSVSSSNDITIKIPSTLSLSAQSFRAQGPFTNTGPIPPRADTESTYTVTWTLTNTTNDLSGATVSAVLPAGVAWKENTSPQSENISYDPDNRTVTWNVTSLAAGVGFANSARSVSFQIGITPNVTQSGTVPTILGESDVSAMDTYASTTLRASVGPLTTQYSDSGTSNGNGVVK